MSHVLIEGEEVKGQYALRLNNLLSNLAECLKQSQDTTVIGYVKSELEFAHELLDKVKTEEPNEAKELASYMQKIERAVK